MSTKPPAKNTTSYPRSCLSVPVSVCQCSSVSSTPSLEQIRQLKSRDGFHDIDLQFADFIINLAGKDEPLLYLAAAVAAYFLRNSHICIDLNRISGTKFPIYENIRTYYNTDLMQITLPQLDEWREKLAEFSEIVSSNAITPLILDSSSRLYLHRYWNYESALAKLIREKCGTKLNRIKTFTPGSISSVSNYFMNSPTDTVDWQQVAIFAALVNNFTLITGGPGTGKTTVASAILTMLLDNDPDLKIKLCAPTGKAAGRLKESIAEELPNLNPKNSETKHKLKELESYTIHRLLEGIRLTPHFRRNKNNPLQADIIIIDEASMVSLTLFAKLMDAVPKSARVILLGDKDQLASVEAGAVLANICEISEPNRFSSDFCNAFNSLQKNNKYSLDQTHRSTSLTNSVVLLKKSRRFDDTKGIGLLKNAINNLDKQSIEEIMKTVHKASDELCLLKSPDIPDIESKIKTYIDSITLKINNSEVKFRDYINAETVEKAYQIYSEFRILCSHYVGKYGAKNINNIIHYLLLGSTRNEKGSPVMITENNNQLELYNGDIGLIWPDKDGINKAYFPHLNNEKLRAISISVLPAHDEVYAMTIHKSQGSGFQKVLMILPNVDSPLLTKELIYTGITRAKKYCEIWANDDVLSKAVLRKTVRDSGLKDKLTKVLYKK